MEKVIKQYVYYKQNRVGLMYAMALDNVSYAVNVSLVNPGRTLPNGKRVGADRFDKGIAEDIAIAKIVKNEPLPKVLVGRSKRANAIARQFLHFRERAECFFQDKNERALVNSLY